MSNNKSDDTWLAMLQKSISNELDEWLCRLCTTTSEPGDYRDKIASALVDVITPVITLHFQKEIERQVLEGRIDELKDINDSYTHLEWIQLSRQKTLSGGIGVATFIDKRLAELRKLQEGNDAKR